MLYQTPALTNGATVLKMHFNSGYQVLASCLLFLQHLTWCQQQSQPWPKNNACSFAPAHSELGMLTQHLPRVEVLLAVLQPCSPVVVVFRASAACASGSVVSAVRVALAVWISLRRRPVHVPVPSTRGIVSVASRGRRCIRVAVRISRTSTPAVTCVIWARVVAWYVGIDIRRSTTTCATRSYGWR